MSETTKARLTDLVADEVRALLARRRISATRLAQELGWSQPYMARRMTGAQPFDLNDLQDIAGALKVKVSDILAHAERGDQSYVSVGSRPLDVTMFATASPARVTGTVAHPGHPIVSTAVPIPAQRTTTNDVRRTAPTGR